MKLKLVSGISFLLIYFIINHELLSQDAHYWSEQFGNKSMLLGGTVNASVEDLGLVYYNPGRLSQIENPAFVISARVFELTNTRITDGLGEGKDLKESSFGSGPSLVAGTFKVPFLEGHNFAYSFLTRYRSKGNFDVRTSEEEGTMIRDIQYDNLSAKLRSNNTFTEEWYGLTWSKPLNEKFSVGVTTFGYSIQSTGAINLQMQGLTDEDKVSMLNFQRQLNFDAYGILWKAGFAAQLKNINLGLTITTPKINIAGKGSSVYEDFSSGIDSIAGVPRDDVYIENYQQNLAVNARSSWAVGLGMGIKFEKTVVHISSEWFTKVNGYTIFEAEEFVGQQPADTINFSLVDGLKSVLNFGIGVEHKFTDKVYAYGSIASDFSAVGSEGSFLFKFDNNNIAHSTFDGDFFHFGGGVSLNFKWAELTIGATHGSAQRTIDRPLNIGEDEILYSDATSKIKFGRWRFLVGFSFPFAAKVTESLGVE